MAALPRETKCHCGEVTTFQFTAALVEPNYLDESRTPEHEKSLIGGGDLSAERTKCCPSVVVYFYG
jgi:hypothetical protein